MDYNVLHRYWKEGDKKSAFCTYLTYHLGWELVCHKLISVFPQVELCSDVDEFKNIMRVMLDEA
jgi:hypothetical protein